MIRSRYRQRPPDHRSRRRRRRLRSWDGTPGRTLRTPGTPVRDPGTPLRTGASERPGQDLHLGDRDLPAGRACRAPPPRRRFRLRLRARGHRKQPARRRARAGVPPRRELVRAAGRPPPGHREHAARPTRRNCWSSSSPPPENSSRSTIRTAEWRNLRSKAAADRSTPVLRCSPRTGWTAVATERFIVRSSGTRTAAPAWRPAPLNSPDARPAGIASHPSSPATPCR